MIGRVNVCLLLAVLLFTVSFADAQQPGKIFRMGLLDLTDARSSAVRLETFCRKSVTLDRSKEKILRSSPGLARKNPTA